MSKTQLVVGILPPGSLAEMAKDASDNELACRLKGLDAHQGKNYAIYEAPTATQSKGITILPAPAVGPTGSTKICEGKMMISPGSVIAVTAFRLP